MTEITSARGGTAPTEGALSRPVRAAGTEDAKILRRPQSAFTAELDLAWFDSLDIAFKSLPQGDQGRTAWLNLDRFSTQWVTALPSPSLGWVLGNGVFPSWLRRISLCPALLVPRLLANASAVAWTCWTLTA